ncbi:MAG: YraN family protein [Spirochaetales bacterium]|nr:YraN family protein [Spirochaetales bacterium]
MRNRRKLKGNLGEEKAARFLIAEQYKICEKNFRTQSGEIDIIAEKEDELVFIEVKTWDSLTEESLEQAINREKQQRMVRISKYYLVNHPQYNDYNIRFDIIFLTLKNEEIMHIKNAFSEG